MDIAMKHLWTFALAALLSGCASNRDCAVFEDARVWNYPSRVLVKNLALSVCLAQIAKDTSTASDAGSSANGYFQYSSIGFEELDEIRALANEFAALKYGGHTEFGAKSPDFNTMKCIDLFHSAELDALVGKFLEERPRERE
jgi:hypothetical protein